MDQEGFKRITLLIDYLSFVHRPIEEINKNTIFLKIKLLIYRQFFMSLYIYIFFSVLNFNAF